jgi:hypothetical protein
MAASRAMADIEILRDGMAIRIAGVGLKIPGV